jgi:hypothetical protein
MVTWNFTDFPTFDKNALKRLTVVINDQVVEVENYDTTPCFEKYAWDLQAIWNNVKDDDIISSRSPLRHLSRGGIAEVTVEKKAVRWHPDEQMEYIWIEMKELKILK